jgi:hypothetical protein
VGFDFNGELACQGIQQFPPGPGRRSFMKKYNISSIFIVKKLRNDGVRYVIFYSFLGVDFFTFLVK